MTFIIYINEILNLNLKGSIILYADYIAIVYGEKNLLDLKISMQNDLQIVSDFLDSHSLQLNAKKTTFIIFPGRMSKAKQSFNSFEVMLETENIQRVSNMRYLGLIIDENLDFKDHITFN